MLVSIWLSQYYAQMVFFFFFSFRSLWSISIQASFACSYARQARRMGWDVIVATCFAMRPYKRASWTGCFAKRVVALLYRGCRAEHVRNLARREGRVLACLCRWRDLVCSTPARERGVGTRIHYLRFCNRMWARLRLDASSRKAVGISWTASAHCTVIWNYRSFR